MPCGPCGPAGPMNAVSAQVGSPWRLTILTRRNVERPQVLQRCVVIVLSTEDEHGLRLRRIRHDVRLSLAGLRISTLRGAPQISTSAAVSAHRRIEARLHRSD